MAFVVLVLGGLALAFALKMHGQHEQSDRCTRLGGVMVQTRGDDVCLDRHAVLFVDHD